MMNNPIQDLLACLSMLELEHADMQNVIFLTPSKFQADKFNPKKCVIFGNAKFATKQRKQQNHKNTLNMNYLFTKNAEK